MQLARADYLALLDIQSHRYDWIHQAFAASAERFLHSGAHGASRLLSHQAQIRSVEMTVTASVNWHVRETFRTLRTFRTL